jgi:2-alkyl-3-oxoalkanoate reductase
VLLTGATGFIGRHLLRRLLAEKDRVRVLVRHVPNDDLFRNERVELFLGNLGNAADVDRAVTGISELYHLGAAVEGWAEDFQCATIAGTENIVTSALKHRVEKLIYMSSLSVIHAAAASNGEPITESWPLEPHAESRGLYSQTKLAAERIVTDAVQEQGLRAVILRPGEVVGPDRPFLSGAAAIEAGNRLFVLGNGRFTVPVVWVDDLVDAIVAAGNSNCFDGSVFHLVEANGLSQDEIVRQYLAVKGAKKKVVHVPLFMLYGAASAAAVLGRLLHRSVPLTPYRLRSAIGRRNFDCTAAAKALDWQPRVGTEEGLRLTIMN